MDKKHVPSEKKLKKAKNEGNSPNAPYFVSSIITLGILGGGGMFSPLIFVRVRKLIELFELQSSDVLIQSTVLLSLLMTSISLLTVLLIVGSSMLLRGSIHISLNQWGSLPLPSRYFATMATSLKDMLFWPFRMGLLLVALYCTARTGTAPHTFYATTFYAFLLAIMVIGVTQRFTSCHRWLKNLMMTDKELMDELKEDEGDPRRRSYRHHLHRELSLEERVKRSRVILVNTIRGAT
jgi:flagellar biosynthesis protein FlhB